MAHRYRNIQTFVSEDDRRYVTNPMYPYIPETEEDTYIITSNGDRYDLLADSFYNDPKLWWIIASANNATADNLAIDPGVQIRIPANKERCLALYNNYNKLR